MAIARALSDRYRLLGTLAERGDRSVRTAQDRLTGQTVVLKLAPAGTEGARLLADEASRLARREHRRLLRLHDCFEGLQAGSLGRVSGFATPWIDGAPLDRAAADLSPAARLALFGQLLDAVHGLHHTGLLHLDLKPSNALVGPDGLVLLDLGTARPTDAGPGEAGGTLGFAAPEVLVGEAAGIGADIYSLGVVLYSLLAGQGPFGDQTGTDLRVAVLLGDIVPLRAVAPQIDPALAMAVEHALRREPGARLSGVPEFARRIGLSADLDEGAPPWVERPELQRDLRRLVRRREQVGLVGPPGSGRRRLARSLVAVPDLAVLDLGASVTLSAALARLEKLVDGPELDGLAQWVDVVLLPEHGVPDSVIGALAATGVAVVRPRREGDPDASVVVLPRLRIDEALVLARHCGEERPAQADRALAMADGWPGPFLDLLRAQEPVLDDLGAEERDGLALLRMLPIGTPASLLDALPGRLQGALAALGERGLVRTDANEQLLVLVQGDGVAPGADTASSLADALRTHPDWARSPPAHWAAVLAARLGLPELGKLPALPYRVCNAHELSQATELLEALCERGVADARVSLAFVLQRQSRFDDALAVLEQTDPNDRVARATRVNVLRQSRRVDEALALCRELDRPDAAIVELNAIAYTGLAANDLDLVERVVDRLVELEGEGESSETINFRVRLAQGRHRQDSNSPALDELVPHLRRWATRDDLASMVLGTVVHAASQAGQHELARQLFGRVLPRVDADGVPMTMAGTRNNYGGVLERCGRSAEARRAYADGLRIAERARLVPMQSMLQYNIARLELRSGRLPDALARMAAYDRLVGDSPPPEMALRGALNRAWYDLLTGDPDGAARVLEGQSVDRVSPDARNQRTHLLAWARLEQGRPSEVLRLLDEHATDTAEPATAPLIAALRGRAHIALGRHALGEAHDLLPEAGEGELRTIRGEVLLAWAGEDLDPDGFVERRAALTQAASLLRGPLAAKAVRLRERLLSGPGANLEGIVALTEAMHDPKAFPEALARLVREALGAHRVLIMLRMPGLGNQLGFTELSGAQAAGIGREVMERISKPGDVWSSADAFADPVLRESSQTVQTFELKSLLAVAIPRGDQAVGALYVDDLYRADRFDADDVALLQRLAAAVGSMLPLMGQQTRATARLVDEPTERLGVHLADARDAEDFDRAVRMLSGMDESNLLLTGATGTGKTFLARRIARDVLGLTDVEMVVLRKGDPQMLVTQLMGSKKGEFTGAEDRKGAVARCIAGRKALFLDEIQNLDEVGQQILLPLLDLPRRFGGLTGASDTLPGALHIILGTNHDVSGNRAFDVFRSDLWYRMSRVHIHLPPIAERGAEVVYRYLADLCERRGAPRPESLFQTAALYRVTHAPWPGNLRELDAFADRAAHLYDEREQPLTLDDLALLRLSDEEGKVVRTREELTRSGAGASLDDAMIRHVMNVLRRHTWVQSYAADELGMNPPALHKFLKRHGLLDEVRRRRKTAD